MNYYEHHLGDYVRDTAHLSMTEDGAYRRLLDAYYIRELPLPASIREIYRLVRASSKPDREAVEIVLREFFVEAQDGWRHSRCDREIGRFQDKKRKARASADARWAGARAGNARNANASADDMRTHDDEDANASADAMRTHENPDATVMPHAGAPGRGRAPVPRHQSPDTSLNPDPARATTPAGRACLAMRRVGLASVNPGDPRLIALLEQGATLPELEGVASEAASKGKGFAWALAALVSRRAEAAAITLAGPPSNTVESVAPDRTAELLAQQAAHADAAKAETPEQRAATTELLRQSRERITASRLAS